MQNDNADPTVLGQTKPAHLEFARLYFRPRTPTLHNTEGIRPPKNRRKGHCPIPVFFLFDFVGVLQRDGTRFSKGSMASPQSGHSDRRDYFRRIEFADVYHDSGLGYGYSPRKSEIIYRRQAEVLVPEELPLEPDLRAVCCRTPAERATLLNRLTSRARKKWGSRIRLGVDLMFFREHPHVKSVRGAGDELEVELYRAHYTEIPYRICLEDEERVAVGSGVIPARAGMQLFRVQSDWETAMLTFELYDCVAFRAPVEFSDLPF